MSTFSTNFCPISTPKIPPNSVTSWALSCLLRLLPDLMTSCQQWSHHRLAKLGVLLRAKLEKALQNDPVHARQRDGFLRQVERRFLQRRKRLFQPLFFGRVGQVGLAVIVQEVLETAQKLFGRNGRSAHICSKMRLLSHFSRSPSLHQCAGFLDHARTHHPLACAVEILVAVTPPGY